jgi:chemotaxis protein CheX
MLSITPSQNAVAGSANALFELAASIWHSLLDLDVLHVADRSTDDLAEESGVLTGCVHFDGHWQGSVLLICPKPLALQTAVAMFKTAPTDITESALHDTIGDLTHGLGGTLKSPLPAPCHLSPPSVMEGYNIRREGRAIKRILLRCAGQPLQIILFEREKKR